MWLWDKREDAVYSGGHHYVSKTVFVDGALETTEAAMEAFDDAGSTGYYYYADGAV